MSAPVKLYDLSAALLVEAERSGSRAGPRQAALKPHRVRLWLTPKLDPNFGAKCADICEVYRTAPAGPQAALDEVGTLSIDEMPGITEPN
jgi:hypothetical protein